MKALLLLALLTGGLGAQEQEPGRTEKLLLRVQFLDSTLTSTFQVRLRGQLVAGLGSTRGGGNVSLGPDGGSAQGIVTGELSAGAGEIIFSTGLWGPQLELSVFPASNPATPRLYARGRNVRVVRDDAGLLYVRASW